MNITFLIMRGAVPPEGFEDPRDVPRRGDIVGAVPAGQLPTAPAVPLFGHVHVTGIPDDFTIDAIKSVVEDQKIEGVGPTEHIRRYREWNFDLDDAWGTGLNPLLAAQLKADGHVTLPMEQAMAHVWSVDLGRAIAPADFAV